MGENGCLEAIGKGMVFAVVLVILPWLVVYHHWERINDWYTGVSSLPVIEEFRGNFQTGAALVGNAFAEKLSAYEQNSEQLSIQDILNNRNNYKATSGSVNSPFVWDRKIIEPALVGRFSSGKRRRMGYFFDYIEKYRDIAVFEMQQSKIPASVTLAQGLLESGAGRSELALKTNNHFGIKCLKKSSWMDDGTIANSDFTHHSLAVGCMQFSDDNDYDRFQVYENVADSYRHHSLLLDNSRYRWIKKFEIGSNYPIDRSLYGQKVVPYYGAWSVGLKSSGYATSKKYAEKLTMIIETYELWKIDYEFIINSL